MVMSNVRILRWLTPIGLNSHVEDWCVTTVGQRLPGKPRHYVRITPADPLAPDPHPDPNTLEVSLAGNSERHPAREIVGGDFFAFGALGRSSGG
jgi:glucoamylase